MEREELVLKLKELAVRFSEGWHEVIEIDALDIMLLNEAAEALAQPALEPVAWMYVNEDGECEEIGYGKTYLADFEGCTPLYTTPPQRPWVGLTAQEAAECWTTSATQTWKNFEAKLKDKNNG